MPADHEPDTQRKKGFLSRLLRDASGNTLAIVGAALVPLAGMIGSGVDMSRAYMAKTRLQSACDAAALAGRRVMQDDTLSAEVTAEAERFFDFNFPEGLYQTAAFDPVITRPETGTVRVEATTTIPTAVMHLFGFEDLPLSVSCDASLNFVNTDVVLVLDVTGSMAWNADGSDTSNVPEEEQRITALREAVMALYEELEPVQEQLEANGMRLRFGIVPYSSTVNVGQLLRDAEVAAGTAYLTNNATYQSRSPIYRQSSSSTTYNNKTRSWCNNQEVALPATNITFPVTEKTTSYNSSQDRCTVTTRVYDRPVTANFGFWYYEPRTFDTSVFKTFDDDVPLPSGSGDANVWNGCIEERTTVDDIDEDSGLSIPGGAMDLNINFIPNSEATRWRPMWPQVEYHRLDGSGWGADLTAERSRHGSSASGACPVAAEELQEWDEDDLQAYVDSLEPVGSTYHDIGLLWGARMISATGVFGDSPDTWNGMPVQRHIIFMTDGELAPSATTYSAYGLEYMDQRVTGSANANGLLESHRQRFRMICNAIPNAQIWVIAFGVGLDADLTGCASNPNQASASADKDELIARFRQIGNQIGALRLTQ
jgi:Flp pilus assembly protein TadG